MSRVAARGYQSLPTRHGQSRARSAPKRCLWRIAFTVTGGRDDSRSIRGLTELRPQRRELTPRGRCHADLRAIFADLNPVLRGWGNYFRTGNAAQRFNQLDTYVWKRLRSLRVARKGRHLRAGEVEQWTRESFYNLGLHRLRGTVRYPEPRNATA